MLQELSDGKLALGVVSNFACCGETLEYELERCGLRSFFDVVIASSTYGIRKPNILIFELAARLLGFSPDEIWFIGDTCEYDVNGANCAGMTSVWYNQTSTTAPEEHSPDFVVANWPEFTELVVRLRNKNEE